MEYYEKNRPYNCTVYYEVKGANKDKIERQITGTYVPKELILDIASWISIEFYSVAYGDVRSPPCGRSTTSATTS